MGSSRVPFPTPKKGGQRYERQQERLAGFADPPSRNNALWPVFMEAVMGVELHCCRSNQSISRVTRFFTRDLHGVWASRFVQAKRI